MEQTERDGPPADPPHLVQGLSRVPREAQADHGQGVVEGAIGEGQDLGCPADEGDVRGLVPGEGQGRQVRVQPRHLDPAGGEGAGELAMTNMHILYAGIKLYFLKDWNFSVSKESNFFLCAVCV